MTPLQQFALIFRSTRPVEPRDLHTRNAAARDWALARRRAGTLRTASPLEDGGFRVTEASVVPAGPDHAIAAVLVIEAPSLDDAVRLAKEHPGLPFGTEIEVRPVKPVAPPP